jgi:hypothetical protein
VQPQVGWLPGLLRDEEAHRYAASIALRQSVTGGPFKGEGLRPAAVRCRWGEPVGRRHLLRGATWLGRVRPSLGSVIGVGLDVAMSVLDVAGRLPGIPVLREHCRALAVVEAIISPDWEYRYYSFNAAWAAGQQMASMRDGSGGEWSIVFCPEGAYARAFDHESPMSPFASANAGPWPGVIDTVPEVFRQFVAEPAFGNGEGTPAVTACLWRETGDDSWRTGTIDFPERRADPDGAVRLFDLLMDRSADAYARFAEDYYEISVDSAAVKAILDHEPLTGPLVATLNPGMTLDDLTADLAEIGCPPAPPGPLR